MDKFTELKRKIEETSWIQKKYAVNRSSSKLKVKKLSNGNSGNRGIYPIMNIIVDSVGLYSLKLIVGHIFYIINS